ncbi:MAG: YdbH domain-containing protein [Novosphingobium sp.]
MTMPEYRAGDASIALPRLALVQLADGALGFAGEARVSGALPGGRAENLVLPLEGNFGAARGLAVWRGCTTLRFDRLALADLTFEHRDLMLCPPRGGAILAADSRGTRIAAGTPALDLTGRLGDSPIRVRSGPVGMAWPGTLAARALDVELGPPAAASHFRIANLRARVGGDIAGSFAGSEVRLAAVPLDIVDAEGAWRFADGRLTLSGARFRLDDRERDARFQPLVAREARLELAGNIVTAEADLREPGSDRAVLAVALRHDLGSARGHADLDVPGIVFDDRLQPDTLTRQALGVIANARGIVRGRGRIDWTAETIASSGRFTTDGLDFAAAFGPVTGAAGTLVFTDLLGQVSAPDQQIRIAAINPGIEVNDGVLTYELRPDAVLAVKGATWPFLDGTLTLLPVTMRLGIAEERRYTLLMSGVDAARLVERMEVANLSVTGTFDGSLPLVFDENGGRIEGGQLRARAPGGNVSYVGALTYKDLSAMANFAFDALKSLDYREMEIAMNGPLAGEIVTRVQFAGIRQGASARRNFLTERIARLPIRFNVNLRAPFFQLVSSFRSLYDPAYVRDPRSLGLLDARGRPRAPLASPAAPNGIQPAESGDLP